MPPTNGVSGGTNGDPGQTSPLFDGLKADIDLLRSLLKDDTVSGDPDALDESTIQELLQKLETADGIAQGVESRLDDIIDNLDGLLESLEAQTREVTSQDSVGETTAGKETSRIAEETKVESVSTNCR